MVIKTRMSDKYMSQFKKSDFDSSAIVCLSPYNTYICVGVIRKILKSDKDKYFADCEIFSGYTEYLSERRDSLVITKCIAGYPDGNSTDNLMIINLLEGAQ